MDRVLELVPVATGGNRHRALEDGRPGVDALVDEVDGHACDLHPGVEGLADRVETRERRQEGRVDVHDPICANAR